MTNKLTEKKRQYRRMIQGMRMLLLAVLLLTSGGVNASLWAKSEPAVAGQTAISAAEPDLSSLTMEMYDWQDNLEKNVGASGTISGISTSSSTSETTLLSLLPETAKRQYCQYSFYMDEAKTQEVTTFGELTNSKVYVKWTYTENAPVFSTGTDATKFQYYAIGDKNAYDSGNVIFAKDDDSGTDNKNNVTTTDAVKKNHRYQWAFVGTPYEYMLYNRGAEKYIYVAKTEKNNSLLLGTLAEIEEAGKEVLKWEMPVEDWSSGNADISSRTWLHSNIGLYFRPKVKGFSLYMTRNTISTDNIWQTHKVLRFLIVPMTVYDDVADAEHFKSTDDVVIKLPHFKSSGTQDGGTTTITSELVKADLSNPNDYTLYTDAACTSAFPNLGVSIYGGSTQAPKAVYAIYTDNSVTFHLFDKDGNREETIEDVLVGSIAANAVLTTVLPASMKRQFCSYTFYSDAAFENEITERGDCQDVYVKWHYADNAPVFSTGDHAEEYQYYTIHGNTYTQRYYYNSDDDTKFTEGNSKSQYGTPKYQWALVGTPYTFRIYNRGAGQYISAEALENDKDITFDDAAAAIKWTMIIPDGGWTTPRDENYNFWPVAVDDHNVRLGNGQLSTLSEQYTYKGLGEIIVPLEVYRQTTSEKVDECDYVFSYQSANKTLKLTDLQKGGEYSNPYYKHGFCNYTFYTDNKFEEEITDEEDMSIYGGTTQHIKKLWTKYTVDERFKEQWLMHLAEATETSNNYLKKGDTDDFVASTSMTLAQARADETLLLHWLFKGDPYDFQIANVRKKEYLDDMANFPMATQAVGGNNNPAVDTTRKMILSGDHETYPYYRWEIIAEGNGYKFFSLPASTGITRRYQGGLTDYTGGAMIIRNDYNDASTIYLEPVLDPDKPKVAFYLYDKDKQPESAAYRYETNIDAAENATVTLADILPARLKRKFCDYTFYTDETLASVTTSMTVEKENTVYVQWTYADNAPVFSTGTDDSQYQYYTLVSSDTQNAAALWVNDEGNFKRNSNPAYNVDLAANEWALLGTPYSMKLYNPKKGQALVPNGISLAWEDVDANTYDKWAVMLGTQTISGRSTETALYLQSTANTCFFHSDYLNNRTLAEAQPVWTTNIIVPFKVYKEGETSGTAVDDQVHVLTYPTTDDILKPSMLTKSTEVNSHPWRHGFCDYTFYSDAAFSILFTEEEGISIFGGTAQQRKQVNATYTVDEEKFSQAWLMYKEDGSNLRFSLIDGSYQQTSSSSTVADVRKAKTATYQWLFKGDPYNFKVTNLSREDASSVEALYPLGAKQCGNSTGADYRMYATDDTETYQYNTWEIIEVEETDDDGSGRYNFYLVAGQNGGTRYRGGFSYPSGGTMSVFATAVAVTTLVPAIAQYDITWVVEDESATEVARETVKNVYYERVLTLSDMPESLRRHFCEYNGMYYDKDLTQEISADGFTVVVDATIYVKYTLTADGAGYFSSSTSDDNYYQIKVGGSGYLKDSGGTLGQGNNPGSDDTSYQWLLIGTPYDLKLYNKSTGKYVDITNTTMNAAISTNDTGSALDLIDDYTGDEAVIRLKNGSVYIGRNAEVFTDNTSYVSAVFIGTNGLNGLTFVLHYSEQTLRKTDGTGASLAGGTETIEISSYQALNKKLIDVLPERWKRAFCTYTFKWGDDEQTQITENMVKAQRDGTGITIDVTYEFEDNSPFKWSTQTSSGSHDNLHWYYMNNHHWQGGNNGNILYMEGAQTLRMDADLDLVNEQFFINNYEWCFIGDPYGFRMLCHYDPLQTYSSYLAVDENDTGRTGGVPMIKIGGSTPAQNLFEMRISTWDNYFWMHPIYAPELMNEDGTYHFMQTFRTGTIVNPRLNSSSNLTSLKQSTTANFSVCELNGVTLLEYVRYAGFVGALTQEALSKDRSLQAIYDDLHAQTPWYTATYALNDAQRKAIHTAIETAGNMVEMKQGYYRIIPYMYEKGKVSGEASNKRVYVRGYLYGPGTSGYDNDGKATTNDYHDRQEYVAEGYIGNKSLLANEPEALAEYDPASIFHFVGSGYAYNVTTQGMNLKGSHLSTSEQTCRYENIGGVLMQLKTSGDVAQIDDGNSYLGWVQNFNGNEPEAYRRMGNRPCFEMYGTSRLYLQPVGTNTDGNEMPFKLKLNKGHESTATDVDLAKLPYTYTSIYVPYDLQLVGGKDAGGSIVDVSGSDATPFVGIVEHHTTAYRKEDDGDYYNPDEYTLYSLSIDIYNKGYESVDESLRGTNNFIPAGTPVLIRSKKGMTELTFNIPTTSPSDPIAANKISGTYLSVANGSSNVYVFGKEKIDGAYTGRVGFFPRSSTSTPLTHNKAYYVPDGGSSGAKGILFELSEDSLSGIQEIRSDRQGLESGQAIIYDLQGRRVKAPSRGLYIVNGRKVVIK